MMKRWIGILGANATGKSTRMMEYIKTLKDQPFEEWHYTFTKKGKTSTILAGRVYGDMLVIGKLKADGLGWAGGDHTWGKLASKVAITDFLNAAEEKGYTDYVS